MVVVVRATNLLTCWTHRLLSNPTAASKEVWMPADEIVLAQSYHPALHSGHPAFGRLPVDAQWALAALEKQNARWEHKPYFKTRGGLENTRIAILNDYHKTERLLNCMMVPNQYSAYTPFGRCGLPACPFCQYLRGQNNLKKFAPAWEQDCCFWLVFSIRGNVNLWDCNAADVVRVWDTIRTCLKRWKVSLDGCAAWEELAVYTFLPDLLCTPHVNTMVFKSGSLDLDLLSQIIVEEWSASGLSVLPDIKIEAFKSEAHFHRSLEYVKPIDLLTPYNTAFQSARHTGDVERLHEAVRHFLDGYAEIISEYRHFTNSALGTYDLRPYARIAHFSYGRCHGSAGKPIGTSAQERRTREHQELINTLKLNAREDEMGQAPAEENHPDNQSHDL